MKSRAPLCKPEYTVEETAKVEVSIVTRGVVKSAGYNRGPAQWETRPPVPFLSYPLLAREQTGYTEYRVVGRC